jgi:TonB family protein
VVVQNTPTDQFPESRGLLTGRPIYSVYVSLGTAKDWTLYFCVPGSAPNQQNQARVITLDTATPVLAPYPTLLEKPAITIPAFFKYVLVHATVNEDGRFQNLRVVRPTRPEADRALLAALANWEFRPASRQGSKIAVEVLLHIPVDGL